MNFRILAFSFSVIILIGCASTNTQTSRYDPIEKFNRSIYKFNYNIFDPYVFRPVAVIWRNYVPQPLRKGLSNFTSNLEEPAIMVNFFLQKKPYQGMIHFTRFFLNTLLGMGGFIDIAGMSNQKMKQDKLSHRFGSTLEYYGVGYGPYIHLPFYGNFTIRNEGGNIIDTFYPALSWLNWLLSIVKWAIEGIEIRARLLDFEGFLLSSSDPYIMMREIYFQHNYVITDSNNIIMLEDNPNAKAIEDELLEIDSD